MPVESADHIFSLIWQKIDPDSGKSRAQEETVRQLKEYSESMKKCRSESGLLFQLFMDRKQHIKQ